MNAVIPACKECGTCLVGMQPVAYEDGPVEAGEKIPADEDDALFEEEIGYIPCPECNRETPLTPKKFYNPPEEL